MRVPAFLGAIAESWIDFDCLGRQFTIKTQFGEYGLFVGDPDCPVALVERRDRFAEISG
jgi:hypothetical protein